MKDLTVTLADTLLALLEEKRDCAGRIAEIDAALHQMHAVLNHELHAVTLTSTLLETSPADAVRALSDDALNAEIAKTVKTLDAEAGLVPCRACAALFAPARRGGGGGRKPVYCSETCRGTRPTLRKAAPACAVGAGGGISGAGGGSFGAGGNGGYDVVWNGGPGLSSAQGQSSLHDAAAHG